MTDTIIKFIKYVKSKKFNLGAVDLSGLKFIQLKTDLIAARVLYPKSFY